MLMSHSQSDYLLLELQEGDFHIDQYFAGDQCYETVSNGHRHSMSILLRDEIGLKLSDSRHGNVDPYHVIYGNADSSGSVFLLRTA